MLDGTVLACPVCLGKGYVTDKPMDTVGLYQDGKSLPIPDLSSPLVYLDLKLTLPPSKTMELWSGTEPLGKVQISGHAREGFVCVKCCGCGQAWCILVPPDESESLLIARQVFSHYMNEAAKCCPLKV